MSVLASGKMRTNICRLLDAFFYKAAGAVVLMALLANLAKITACGCGCGLVEEENGRMKEDLILFVKKDHFCCLTATIW